MLFTPPRFYFRGGVSFRSMAPHFVVDITTNIIYCLRVKTITQKELVEILKSAKGAEPITIVARTPKKLLDKTTVFKTSRINGFTGFDYENSVNMQGLREDKFINFKSKKRVWGARTYGTLVEYKNNFYLRFKPKRTLSVSYDRVFDKNLLPPVPVPNQPTIKKIYYRNFLISNILRLTIDKVVYKVVERKETKLQLPNNNKLNLKPKPCQQNTKPRGPSKSIPSIAVVATKSPSQKVV